MISINGRDGEVNGNGNEGRNRPEGMVEGIVDDIMNDARLELPLPRRDAGALAAARESSLRALRAQPVVTPWQRQAATMMVVGLTVTVVGALTTARLAGVQPRLLDARLPAVALLLVAQAVALWSAIAPGRWWGRNLAWAATALGAGLLLFGRASVSTPSLAAATTGWICSASHLGVGLVPAVVMLGFLRGISWSLPRAITAGMAVGISGLIWGEIACERSLGHVLVHHVGAMALMTLACAALAHRLSRGAFAP